MITHRCKHCDAKFRSLKGTQEYCSIICSYFSKSSRDEFSEYMVKQQMRAQKARKGNNRGLKCQLMSS